jgi:hypothetical protein
MTVANCTPSSAAKVQLPVRYWIEDSFSIEVRNAAVSIWAPIIPETPYQRLIDFRIETEADYELTRDGEFGNAMLHSVLVPSSGDVQAFKLSYGVERLRVLHMLDSSCARPLMRPEAFARHLSAEKHVEVNPKTRALAQRL